MPNTRDPTAALVASTLHGADTEVVQYLVACLRELGQEPAVEVICEVLAPFAVELELSEHNVAALGIELAAALCGADIDPWQQPVSEPEPEPEPELRKPWQGEAKQQRQQRRPQRQQHQRDRSQQQHMRQDSMLQLQPEQKQRYAHTASSSPGTSQARAGAAGSLVADVATVKSACLLQTSSLSPQQKDSWVMLSQAVADATPSPREAKKGPPEPAVLEAMRSARDARNTFVAGLSPVQQQDAKRLLKCEKQARKARIQEEAAQFKVERSNQPQQGYRVASVLTHKQKEVMTRAFWLYQQDRRQEAAEGSTSSFIESTEWKRVRALGSASPMLCAYLKRARWDRSWPWPQPEGRLLRREGQQAAVARYSR